MKRPPLHPVSLCGLFITCATFFLSCTQQNSQQQQPLGQKLLQNDSMERFRDPSTPLAKDTGEVLPQSSGAAIDTADARAMVAKYLQSVRYIQHRANSSASWQDDTRFIWFDSSAIGELYRAMKAEKDDGIRVYLGVHNKPEDPKYLYTTVLFTPTQQSISGKDTFHIDYFGKAETRSPKFWTGKATVTEDGTLCPPPKCHSVGASLLPEGY